ncbi:reverse transcriptase domain, reverse transcriptase zinc-binding domain protein [Tanacetum coccineum]
MDIRYSDSKVSCYNMVWFPYCIPRHAFNYWLIVRKKLTTQDLIPVWDRLASLGTVCSLCESIPDSHEPLFFECSFAHGVCDRLKHFAGLDSSNPNIYDIIQSILPIAKRRTMKSVVAKIVVAATAYFIWQERNWRLFKKSKRTNDQIVDCIKTSVRLKLLSCKLKKSKNGERMARLWELPEAVFILKLFAGLDSSNPNIYDIIQSILSIAKRRTMKSVVAKIVVAATAYFIWQERNWRLFKKGKRTNDQIVDCIKTSVRLKLLSCKLKKSKNGERMARLWELPEAVFI